jgi:hypothetical protein
MPRFLVTTHRAIRSEALTACDAVKNEPGITLLSANDPESVTIEASEDAADRLRTKLRDTHFVEPEIRRGLH